MKVQFFLTDVVGILGGRRVMCRSEPFHFLYIAPVMITEKHEQRGIIFSMSPDTVLPNYSQVR